MTISVIFPCYNEKDSVAPTMRRALESLRRQPHPFEILLINDASTDGTAAICDQLAAQHPEIRVLHNPANLGQGATLIRGFQSARHDYLIHNAIDYPFDLEDLPILTAATNVADIVVACRRARAGYSPYRVLTSRVNRALIRFLFPLRLTDYNFVQLYRRDVWEQVNVEARSTGFVTPEALIRAHDMGYRVREVEVDYHPRTAGTASSGKPKVIVASMADMLRFWWKRALGHTPRTATPRHETS
jgi:dolichol-phosphate mannosyltransferase